MSEFLHIPIQPVEIDGNIPISELLDRMGGGSFQGRNLSLARDVWKKMLSDHTTIFMGLAGALVPAGMRKVLAHVIKNRWIDCLVSTGANLFHDIHETLGKHHWRGSHEVDDCQLKEAGIDRIYDTFALEQEFRETDEYIAGFAAALDQSRPYSTREFLNLLGKSLCADGTQAGILSSASKAGVPVYCPAIGDSSIGIAVACGRRKGENSLNFDIVADVLETAEIVVHSESTGVIYLGGGTPKNFIQQTEVTASIMGEDVPGHRYALQVITDPPHWGGLSGCTFAEAQSWGKIAIDASAVTVYCDATIALPIIATALQEERQKHPDSRQMPQFNMGSNLEIEIQ
jgi:deoxyhypusine synthase